MKKDMPLEGLRWSRDSGSALYDTPQNGRSRTGWGGCDKNCHICNVTLFGRMMNPCAPSCLQKLIVFGRTSRRFLPKESMSFLI